MGFSNLATNLKMVKNTRIVPLFAVLSALLSTASVCAQAAPESVPSEPAPLLQIEPAPAVVPTQPPPSSVAVDVRALTGELLALEGQAAALEAQRKGIRVRGMRIGKIISWTVTTLMLTSAFGSFGTAEQIKEAIKDGRDDKAYDSDGDKDVDKDDEQRARRIARALAISSLVPIGLGVWTSIVYRQRLNKQRDLSYQLEDVSLRRRSLLQRMGAELGVSQQHASLQVRLVF
jgi:hypothetical protein